MYGPVLIQPFRAQPVLQASAYPLLAQLGAGLRQDLWTKNLLLNLPLIERCVQEREAMIRPLYTLLSQSMSTPQIIEGLYLAQRLAEENVAGVRSLYAAAARFNTTTNPYIQVYLAGFYRKLNAPETFGPMLAMFMREAMQSAPVTAPFDPLEEIGGTLLQQIANTAAQEVILRLKNKVAPQEKRFSLA